MVEKETENQFRRQSAYLIAETWGWGVMNTMCGPERAGCIPVTLLFEGLNDSLPLPEAPNLSLWYSTLKRRIYVHNWLPDIDTP